MKNITLYHDNNNILNCKYIIVLREADTWMPGDEVELFYKEESKGIYTIAEMYAREKLQDIACHLPYVAYGISKETLIEKMKDYYEKRNINIDTLKFQWLIITTEK